MGKIDTVAEISVHQILLLAGPATQIDAWPWHIPAVPGMTAPVSQR